MSKPCKAAELLCPAGNRTLILGHTNVIQSEHLFRLQLARGWTDSVNVHADKAGNLYAVKQAPFNLTVAKPANYSISMPDIVDTRVNNVSIMIFQNGGGDL